MHSLQGQGIHGLLSALLLVVKFRGSLDSTSEVDLLGQQKLRDLLLHHLHRLRELGSHPHELFT